MSVDEDTNIEGQENGMLFEGINLHSCRKEVARFMNYLGGKKGESQEREV